MTDPILAALRERAAQLAPDLVRLRRDLHRHPELSFGEVRTAETAARAVAEAGFSVRTGIARTGVVAELDAGAGPLVALRADMDALPIEEANDLPWRSEVAGVMHACGHDAHVAGLVGAARLLSALAAEGALPPGRIRLLFQPSEERMDDEGKSGGRRMAEEGAMDGVDAVVGLHVAAHLPSGEVHLAPGPFLAGTDTLRITVEGKAAHAGRPHQGVDALVLAAQGILSVQQVVARRIPPEARGVVSLGRIEGGAATNIVCERVELGGTIRYFEEEIRRTLRREVEAVFRGLEHQGARVTVRWVDGYPPVVNDPDVTRRVQAVARAVADPERVPPNAAPQMTAEDFSFLAAHAPGAFFWLGAGLPDPREHHHPRFDVDEAVLPLGAALLAGSAVELLRTLPR